MTILDYKLTDLMFAYWLKRKREIIPRAEEVPAWLDAELDRLRPLRNPNCSIFVLDNGPLYAA